MAELSDKEWLSNAYQTYLNRDPVFGGKLADGRDDPGDADYWLGQLASGASRSSINTHFNTSPEAQELRQNIFDLAEDPNAPTDVIERHNQARANTALGGSAMAEAKKNYTGIFTDYSNSSTDTSSTDTSSTDTATNTNTDTAAAAAASSGLTLDDLNSWWDTKQSKQTDKFDQFTEFMGLLSGMGGMFGGSNVPGFASGGVAAASPYNNFMGFMNAFKSLGGGSQQADISTGNIN